MNLLLASNAVRENSLGTYLATKISQVAIYVHKMKKDQAVQTKHGLGPAACFHFPKGQWGQLVGDSGVGPPVVTQLSLSVLSLWSLGFACTVCLLQGGVNLGGVGVIRSGSMWSEVS